MIQLGAYTLGIWSIVGMTVGTAFGLFLLLLVYLNIRNYRISKKAYFHEKAMRKRNMDLFHGIIDQMEPLKGSYPDYVYMNISSKVFFIMNMIKDMDGGLESQGDHLQALSDRLFESIARLRENYYDVASIIAPLNNLISEFGKNGKK